MSMEGLWMWLIKQGKRYVCLPFHLVFTHVEQLGDSRLGTQLDSIRKLWSAIHVWRLVDHEQNRLHDFKLIIGKRGNPVSATK